jgi:hypothetical protein
MASFTRTGRDRWGGRQDDTQPRVHHSHHNDIVTLIIMDQETDKHHVGFSSRAGWVNRVPCVVLFLHR